MFVLSFCYNCTCIVWKWSSWSRQFWTHKRTHTLLSASSAAEQDCSLLQFSLTPPPPPSPTPPCIPLCSPTPPPGAPAEQRVGQEPKGLQWSSQCVSSEAGTPRKKVFGKYRPFLFFNKQSSVQGEGDKQPNGVEEADMANWHKKEWGKSLKNRGTRESGCPAHS